MRHRTLKLEKFHFAIRKVTRKDIFTAYYGYELVIVIHQATAIPEEQIFENRPPYPRCVLKDEDIKTYFLRLFHAKHRHDMSHDKYIEKEI